MSVNKVILIGRLGSDPELKTVGTGSVCKLSVATSSTWKDKEGKKQESTEWHNVDVWGKVGNACAASLSKGKLVYIEGALKTKSWQDKEGKKRFSTNISAIKVDFLGPEDANNNPVKSTFNIHKDIDMSQIPF